MLVQDSIFKMQKKITCDGRTVWESNCGSLSFYSEDIIEKISKKEMILLDMDKENNYLFKILD